MEGSIGGFLFNFRTSKYYIPLPSSCKPSCSPTSIGLALGDSAGVLHQVITFSLHGVPTVVLGVVVHHKAGSVRVDFSYEGQQEVQEHVGEKLFSMMPSKMARPVTLLLETPPHTWTLYGCLSS